MTNYTVEDFEKWLNADKSRKAGLRGWWWVLTQIRTDADLQASLIHGNDEGGWNFSDSEWRKDYKYFGESFDDYYQVFLKYKTETDAKEEPEENYKLEEFKQWLENNKEREKVKKAVLKIDELEWDKIFPSKTKKEEKKSQQTLNTLIKNKMFEEMPEEFKPIHIAIHLWKEEKDSKSLPILEENWWENNNSWVKWGGGTVVFLLIILFIMKRFFWLFK